MKKCPECNLELPNEAHFCPRCMYEYPRVRGKQENSKVVNKKKRIIIVGILALAVLALNLKVASIRREKAIEEQERRRESLIDYYMLDTGKNPSIVYDLQKLFVYGYGTITAPMLGEEIAEEYLSESGNGIIRKFENVTLIMLRDSITVSDICIDYTNADETFKEQYGIGDINGKLRRDDVMDILGEPIGSWPLYEDKEWYSRNEWEYHFDGMGGTPRLLVTFGEDGLVTQLEYWGEIGQSVY